MEKTKRWTGICQNLLGGDYEILEHGLNGRTTVYDDCSNPYLNGKSGLGYSLISQKPIDLVVLFLGTNDLKTTDAHGAANGVDELIAMLMDADAMIPVSQPIFPKGIKVLLVSPPHIADEIAYLRPESALVEKAQETHRFAKLYQNVAEKYGVNFLDAAQYTRPSLVDCVHIDIDSHKMLGDAIAVKIREIFCGE